MALSQKGALLARLRTAGQAHLLAFWDQLDAAQQTKLAEQIRNLDLRLITNLIQHRLRRAESEALAEPWTAMGQRAGPPLAFRLGDRQVTYSPHEAWRCGQEALRAGKIGIILVAGGQGTRLGFDHPKGMFPLGPVSQRSLFQILFERLVAIGQRYGVPVPIYLMTSPATDDETRHFLGCHDRFGIGPDDLHVFCQGVMPAVDDEGRILLAAKDSLSLAPDGHGGMLAAFAKSGCLDAARRRGIDHLCYGQIDNPLLQSCDPELVGYHLLAGSELTTQVVAKAGPLEKVGNVVSLDGRLRIIEYSDLPDELAMQTNSDGSLRLWAGNIGVHVFALTFFRRMLDEANALPFHVAKKKVPYIDEQGHLVEPTQPNALKFERFIFDLLPHARNAIVVETDRATSFAPVKNGNEAMVDTPKIAQAMMVAQHKLWLRQAGAVVQDGVSVEISPLFALDAEELATKIEPGLTITEDRYFR